MSPTAEEKLFKWWYVLVLMDSSLRGGRDNFFSKMIRGADVDVRMASLIMNQPPVYSHIILEATVCRNG